MILQTELVVNQKMNKFIFLDIDGPLNTGRSDYMNPEKYGHHFDDVAVKNLRRIINETAADIVLSSSWRHMGLTRIKEIWRSWGLPGNVVGCTPGCWGDDLSFSTRGEEIQKWLKENAEEPYSYVILDDMGKEEATPEQQDVWITVDPCCGISTSEVQSAISILNSSFSCGFQFLDGITENWQQPQLVILAARPSCCKTAFALNVVRYITVAEKVPAGYISLVEPAGILQHRVYESFIEVNPESAPLLMDDTPHLTLNEICEKIRAMVKNRGARLGVVDYLEQIQSDNDDAGLNPDEREGRKAEQAISTLKTLSEELGVPILLIAILSRKWLWRKGDHFPPKICDLSYGGKAAKKCADTVLFIRRIGLSQILGNSFDRMEPIIIDIAKQPNGKDESIILHYETEADRLFQPEIPMNKALKDVAQIFM